MYDNELMLRDGSTNLTSDMVSVWTAIPPTITPLELRIVVPALASPGDTIAPTLKFSHDGAGVGDVTVALPTIVQKGEYHWPFLPSPKMTFVGIDLDINGSNFGKVTIGLVPAGRYTGGWSGESDSM